MAKCLQNQKKWSYLIYLMFFIYMYSTLHSDMNHNSQIKALCFSSGNRIRISPTRKYCTAFMMCLRVQSWQSSTVLVKVCHTFTCHKWNTLMSCHPLTLPFFFLFLLNGSQWSSVVLVFSATASLPTSSSSHSPLPLSALVQSFSLHHVSHPVPFVFRPLLGFLPSLYSFVFSNWLRHSDIHSTRKPGLPLPPPPYSSISGLYPPAACKSHPSSFQPVES